MEKFKSGPLRHSRNPSTSANSPPEDKYYLIYGLIFFLGISGHLPWNTILTAQPYFKAKLAQSSMGSEFTAHFAIIFKTLKLAVFAAVSLAGIKINNKLWRQLFNGFARYEHSRRI